MMHPRQTTFAGYREERVQLLCFCAFCILLNAMVIAWKGEQTDPDWYLFFSFAGAPSIYLSFRRAITASAPVRLRWYLWSISLALFTTGYVCAIFVAAHILPNIIYFDGHAWAALSSSLALLVVAMPLVKDADLLLTAVDVTLAFVACVAVELLQFRSGHLVAHANVTTHLLLTLNIVTGLAALVARAASDSGEERDLLLKIALVECLITAGKLYLTEYRVLYLHRTDQDGIWCLQDLFPLLTNFVLLAPARPYAGGHNEKRYLTRSGLFGSLLVMQVGLCALIQRYRPEFLVPDLAILLVCYGLRGAFIHRIALATTDNIQRELAAAVEMIDVDPLTQIGNRRAFDKTLEMAWKTSGRAGTPVSLILIDVDHFKTINDTLGHPGGDTCLVAVASALRTAGTRTADTICRYAGDEFAVILPGTTLPSAVGMAHRIRASMQETNRTKALGCNITLSIGVATCEDVQQLELKSLVTAADEALYKAKDEGRDCIRSASASSAELNRIYEL